MDARKKTRIWHYAMLTVGAVFIALLVRIFIAQPFIVSGDSMLPTFRQGEYLVIDEISYTLHHPERGDIAVFRYPLDPSVYFIKRVIGVPGDSVTVDNGVVTIHPYNGTTSVVLTEPYILPAQQKADMSTTTLGDDEYFVLGDNRNESFDSRVWGPVPLRYMIGRAWVRIFPIKALAFMPGAYRFAHIPVATSTIDSEDL